MRLSTFASRVRLSSLFAINCKQDFRPENGRPTELTRASYACAQASFVFSRQIHHLNPAMLRAGGFGVITVCRPLEKASLLKELSPSFRNIAILVEDSTILSAEMERTSSNMVRVWRRRAYAERNACSRVHYSAEPCACGGMNELVAVIGSLAYQRC